MSYSAISRLTQIISQAALATDFRQQALVIVDGISQALAVDVCSLYQRDQEANLVLVASHGLANVHPVRIPQGKGLVGQVVRTGQVMNIIDPDQQPDYFYVPDTDEALFKSFCGVPLIQHAQVVGVLVVQRKQPQLICADDEAVLLTLASHLALLLSNLHAPLQVPEQRLFTGVSGAKGLAIGRASLRQSETLAAVHPQFSQDANAEKAAWASLQASTLTDLQRERDLVKQTMGESMAAVLDAYQQLLLDPLFMSRLEHHLAQGSALPWAIKQTVSHVSDLFLGIEDPYLRARHEDIVHLGDKLYQVWHRLHAQQGQTVRHEYSDLQEPFILCGDNIGVSDLANLPTGKLEGIVCSGGAALSHVAVFANALGIPAVMGIGELPVEHNELMIIDGDHGEVQINPSDAVVKEYRALIDERHFFNQQANKTRHLPATTRDGLGVTIMANSGLQADILPGLNNGAEGIGLYRTELPFMLHPNLPTENEQVQIYRHVIEAYGDKPVCFRLLDIGGDKPLTYLPPLIEENPALGLRGIRFLLDNELILKTQLRAILRASLNKDTVQILLPMVTSTLELKTFSALLDAEIQRLNQEGIAACRPALGVMVEVPGVVSMLPLWRNRIDFISIGSNDLSQYLLAVDRNNPLVARNYDPLHPAVLHEIHRIVMVAEQAEMPLSLCGEMASDPISVLLLLGMGIRCFSMSAARIPAIKWLIQQVTAEEMTQLVQKALNLDDATTIRKLVEQALATLPTEAKPLLRY